MLAYYYQKYQTKTLKSKNETDSTNTSLDITKYYTISLENKSTTYQNLSSRCRVCLNEGTFSIFEQQNTSEILEALQVFGNITIRESDQTKMLCSVCYRFIMQALLFRKVAANSQNISRRQSEEQDASETKYLNMYNIEVKVEQDDELTIDETLECNIDIGNSLEAATALMDSRNKVEKDFESMQFERIGTGKITKVTCPICNKVLLKRSMRQHLVIHNPESKYVCHDCGKIFTYRAAFTNHIRIHKKDFRFKCKVCPYRTIYSVALRNHMAIHSGLQKFMCSECPARFYFRSNLNSHTLRHGDPQFKCDVCSKVFYTKPLLNNHFEAIHLGIKKHVCNICGSAFGFRKSMVKHQTHVHNRKKSARSASYLLTDNNN